MRIVLGRITVCWLTGAALTISAQAVAGAPTWRYRIVAEHPHDPNAFTEGLLIVDRKLVESTGRYGESKLIVRELKSGRILNEVSLGLSEFGEGVAAAAKRYYQLTWRGGRGYIYDQALQRIDEFSYFTEGWGLTYDGRSLIQSDGSATLTFRSPDDFSERKRILVHDGARTISQLNELEYVDGLIYANVWLTDQIAVIDAADGHVTAWLDLSGLKKRFKKPANWNATDNVLNGIAYDAASGHFWLTGKCWPYIYEIRLDR